MDSRYRYDREREFTDVRAEKALSNLPTDLRLSAVGSFEELFKSIHYLRSVPGFYGDISGKNVLELGCGNGWISLRFAKSGAHVWACDISPKMIELARRLAQAAHIDVSYDTMIVEEMSYEDNFFDFAFMHMALHHCDIPATAREVSRVLKPGGRAVFVEDYAYHPAMRIYRAFTPGKHTRDEHALTDSDLAALVSDFSSYSFEYSGLFNLFETSNSKLMMLLKPASRWLDDFLSGHVVGFAKYSRIVITKVVK